MRVKDRWSKLYEHLWEFSSRYPPAQLVVVLERHLLHVEHAVEMAEFVEQKRYHYESHLE